MKKFVDIIWNISLVCPWDCRFCCVDAVNVRKIKGKALIREKGLSEVLSLSDESRFSGGTLDVLDGRGIKPTIYDIALNNRQRREEELLFQEKINVLKHLNGFNVKIDFAGGDPFVCYENFLVVREAAKIFGVESISVTTTGASIDSRYDFDEVCESIGQFEFTFDESVLEKSINRPSGYNKTNIKLASNFIKHGVKCKAQMPLHHGNIDPKTLRAIYQYLHENRIDSLLVMRTFPSGRAIKGFDRNWQLSRDDLLQAIHYLLNLERDYGRPKVKLQCALKNLLNEGEENPCDMVRDSFGINAKGVLLSSIWATDPKGDPLHEDWVLGNISREKMGDILKTEKVQRYMQRLDENYGHCKIFAYFNSDQKTFDSIFSNNDPLYEEV